MLHDILLRNFIWLSLLKMNLKWQAEYSEQEEVKAPLLKQTRGHKRQRWLANATNCHLLNSNVKPCIGARLNNLNLKV